MTGGTGNINLNSQGNIDIGTDSEVSTGGGDINLTTVGYTLNDQDYGVINVGGSSTVRVNGGGGDINITSGRGFGGHHTSIVHVTEGDFNLTAADAIGTGLLSAGTGDVSVTSTAGGIAINNNIDAMAGSISIAANTDLDISSGPSDRSWNGYFSDLNNRQRFPG